MHDACALFAQQREEWEPAFEQAGRTITVSDEIRHPVLATPGSLAQVLATVVENSLRYGAGTTSVSVRSANGGHAVFIDIADEGEGVAEDIAPHVFERHVSGYGSTGVGLALAKDLVEADGGREAREALWSHPDMVPSETELATPDTFLTLRRAAAEEDADIDAALTSLLDGTLGWAEGLEPGADSGEESSAPGDGEATEGSDPHDNE